METRGRKNGGDDAWEGEGKEDDYDGLPMLSRLKVTSDEQQPFTPDYLKLFLCCATGIHS